MMSMLKFTNSTQGKGGDEIDLNDIFSDYFTHEFDDPVNNPYNAMLAVAAQQNRQNQQHQQQQQQYPQSQLQGYQQGTLIGQSNNAVQSVSLPTGRGIMTPFHIGALPTISASAAHMIAVQSQQQQQPQPQAANQQVQNFGFVNSGQQQMNQVFSNEKKHPLTNYQNQQLQQLQGTDLGGNNNNDQMFGTVAKKHKGGITLQTNNFSTQQPASFSGTSQGLGSVGQATMTASASGAQNVASVYQTQTNGISSGTNDASNVTLPVGHGIRLGGALGSQMAAFSSEQFLNPEGGLSQQVIEERRQRNREHAKRSRVRKKFLLESLQEEVKGLQDENKNLRLIIQEHIPEHAQKILTDICTGSHLFDDNVSPDFPQLSEGGGTGDESLTSADFTLMKALMSGQQCFVLSDPRLPDNPIVFASQGFYDLTGYSREEVLGRNCRFLQGPGTDPRAVEVIRKAVAKGTEASVLLLNYKADRTPFWNQFFIAPLRGADDNIVNYVGVQCLVEPDVGDSALEEKVNAVLPLQNKDEEEEPAPAKKK